MKANNGSRIIKTVKKDPERSQKQKAKKIIIVVFFCLIVFCVLYFTVPALLRGAGSGEVTTEGGHSLIFYEPDFDEDISEDKIYMGLDRNFYFEDPDYGTTISVTPEDLGDVPTAYRSGVAFLIDYLQNAIDGDFEKLNSKFTSVYYANGQSAKIEFTPQKLYNMKITIAGTSSATENGAAYPSYTYWVEYMIRKNNGTFRNDIESDCSRKELFTITDRDGNIGIDNVQIYRTVIK